MAILTVYKLKSSFAFFVYRYTTKTVIEPMSLAMKRFLRSSPGSGSRVARSKYDQRESRLLSACESATPQWLEARWTPGGGGHAGTMASVDASDADAVVPGHAEYADAHTLVRCPAPFRARARVVVDAAFVSPS